MRRAAGLANITHQGKVKKYRKKRLPMAIKQEVGTKPMHLDKEIRGNQTISPSY